MPVSEKGIVTFSTVHGRNILAEVPNLVATPYLLVTMVDLWPQLENQLPEGTAVHFVDTMERVDLELQPLKLAGFSSVIGIGGGQAIDCAKHFARCRCLPLFPFPILLSVDAIHGQRAGVREKGIVRYVGWAVPETVYFDYAILEAAPNCPMQIKWRFREHEADFTCYH